MPVLDLDHLPGYRRRFVVTPAAGHVRVELEDDYHCMAVTIRHANGVATSVEPILARAPWTTCPGAVAELKQTFTHVAIDAFAERGEKTSNCTHLHDMAVLGAAHARDKERLIYNILVSDPVDGTRRAELRHNDVKVMGWTLEGFRFTAPADLAGMTLEKMRTWTDALGPVEQEYARLLRWGAMIAHGRQIPMENQSDARKMRMGSCYTFQTHRIVDAKRIGKVRDFSNGTAQLLDTRETTFGGASSP
jgi:hypothetical protein